MTVQENFLKDLDEFIASGEVEVLTDNDRYINLLQEKYPFSGSKIDWEQTSAHVEKKIETNDDELAFYKDLRTSAQIPNGQQIVFISDNDIAGVLIFNSETLDKILERILDLPQHKYLLAESGEWCLNFTMEGFADFGRCID